MSAEHIFERITVIGLGLIGSSIARGAHERQVAKTVIGCDHNEISLAYAKKHGFIDIGSCDMQEAVKGSNLVILATPPSTLASVAEAIAPHLSPGTIVMDVCSVKMAAIEAISPHIPQGVHFVPAHPIAGSQLSGVAAGRGDMFVKKRIVLTPNDAKLDFVLQNVTSFWRALGGRCEAMPPHLHDLIYGYVSHLPQLLAFAAAAPLEAYLDQAENDVLLQKFLRLVGSDPDMWIDIFILNKDNVLKALNRYLDALSHIMDEFAQAPSESPGNASDAEKALIALFPRIAASCLITTVMEAEKLSGFSFARYAGTGFADFTYPASQPPEDDIESISNQYKDVVPVLRAYIQRLKEFHSAINSEDDQLFAAQ